MHDMQMPVVPELPDIAAEVDFLSVLRFGQQPRVANIFPVIRQFDLLSLHDFLFEYAQFITDRIARGGNIQRRHGIQITGGETAKTAVAETGVGFEFKYIRRLKAQIFQRFF